MDTTHTSLRFQDQKKQKKRHNNEVSNDDLHKEFESNLDCAATMIQVVRRVSEEQNHSDSSALQYASITHA